MEEKKFVAFKKEELAVKDFIKASLGKGKISAVNIEYTPVGEKIVIATAKPGLIIGRKGEKIEELTRFLKKKFKLDNPHIEIKEITNVYLDAQLVADEIALLLERKGSLKFKVIAYKMLSNIMKAGALGTEIVMSGRLPSERAKSWRFAQGYLKKTGFPANVVDRAQAQAVNLQGVSGIQVSILPPDAIIHDKIDDKLVKQKIHGYIAAREGLEKEAEAAKIEAAAEKKRKKESKKKSTKGEKSK